MSLNAIFETHRKHSLERMVNGPRIVITGSEYSGKSTILRILANFAIRNEWNPMIVDLDPSASEISV